MTVVKEGDSWLDDTVLWPRASSWRVGNNVRTGTEPAPALTEQHAAEMQLLVTAPGRTLWGIPGWPASRLP